MASKAQPKSKPVVKKQPVKRVRATKLKVADTYVIAPDLVPLQPLRDSSLHERRSIDVVALAVTGLVVIFALVAPILVARLALVAIVVLLAMSVIRS